MASVTETPPSPRPPSLAPDAESSAPKADRDPTAPAAAKPTPARGGTLYRMSYELYERIADEELLRSSDHVVLLDGLLVNQMSKGPRHRNAVYRGLAALQVALPPGWVVWNEQPIALRGGPAGDSAPEPDLAVVFGNLERYEDRHPEGAEVGLVVEISSSLDAVRVDRSGLARYAFAGIPLAWVVNIPERAVEVYSEPSGPSADPGYRRFETLRPGQTLAGEIGHAETGPAALAAVAVEAFFPPE